MDSTTTFVVRKKLNVDHNTFLKIYKKPARALRLRGQIVSDGEGSYHFRLDGRVDAVKEYLVFVSIGAPALGTVSGVYLWVGDELYTDAEALFQRPAYLIPPDDPTEDAVVPVAYIPKVRSWVANILFHSIDLSPRHMYPRQICMGGLGHFSSLGPPERNP